MKFFIKYLFFVTRWILILMIGTLLVFGAKQGTLNNYSITRLAPLALLLMAPDLYRFHKYYLKDEED